MRYGVVLRAINVGRHNRVSMEAVRGAVEAAGCAAVRSYLQTGNLTLDADETDALIMAERIEGVLVDLGLRGAQAMVRPWADIVGLADLSPFEDQPAASHRHLVSFCRAPIPEPLEEPWLERGITFLGGPPWALFAVMPRDLVGAPNANALIERRWGIPASTRFWNVVTDWVVREEPARD